MANVSRTEIANVDINKLYDTILDYGKYPEFVESVKKINVLSKTDKAAKVEYEVSVIKTFKYIINLKQERPSQISWTLDSGDLFKKNNGEWKLKDLGNGKTEVTYSLDLDLKATFIPGLEGIFNGLTKKNLPEMMGSFIKRAQIK